ncbi:hypothetical protein AYJ70_16020 [Pseudomonas monteilii]|uniref:Uncharacterized protein n=1 Tax=Pseudomonas monteilii TaxID=76759 RepID=A0AAP7FLX1_9PSED|nr:hypothetical protein AYJ70_16020 [Pseudomonas monteilii]
MLEEILPYDRIPFPYDLPMSFQWVVELFRWREVDIAPFQLAFSGTAKQATDRAKPIKMIEHCRPSVSV